MANKTSYSAEWIDERNSGLETAKSIYADWHCSNCGFYTETRDALRILQYYRYCPSCGSKMKEHAYIYRGNGNVDIKAV